MAVFCFESIYCLPVNGYYSPYVDLLWNASNTANLSFGYPLTDPQFAGLVLNYHCWQEILYACHKIIFGTAAYDLYAFAAPVLMGWTIALAVSALFEHESNDKKSLLLYIAKVFSFFASGSMITCLISRNNAFGSQFNSYFLTSEGGEGLAISGTIAVFVLLRELLSRKGRLADYILIALVAFAYAGNKAPVTILMVASVFGTLIVKSMAEKKLDLKLVKAFAAFVLPSALVLLFVVNASSHVNSDNELFFSSLYSWMNSGIHKYMEPLDQGPVGRIISYLLYGLSLFGPMALIWIVAIINDAAGIFSGKKKLSADLYVAYASAIVAAGGVIFTFQISSSHRQFMIAGVPMMLYAAWKFAEQKQNRAVTAIIALTLCLGIFSDTMDIKDNAAKHADFSSGASFNHAHSISLSEKEACEWIRDNTAPDSVIAVDRRFIDDSHAVSTDRYFYYTAFMERSEFVGGSFYHRGITQDDVNTRVEINDKIYASSGEELEKLLKDNGIDYIVVTKSLGTEFEPGNSNLKVV
ncbi:MAG: hypothetical protein HUJ98_13150 [Bacteroidaceae bacterium]|nr:hypothetical protein [Bacteroidaceae bacterium]